MSGLHYGYHIQNQNVPENLCRRRKPNIPRISTPDLQHNPYIHLHDLEVRLSYDMYLHKVYRIQDQQHLDHTIHPIYTLLLCYDQLIHLHLMKGHHRGNIYYLTHQRNHLGGHIWNLKHHKAQIHHVYNPELKKYPLDWFLREAQNRGIDVKAILINLLFPEPVQSSNRPHLLRDEIPTRNREHRLFDGGRDPSPGDSERRRVESSYEQGGGDRTENLSIRQSPSHGSGVTGEPAAARPPTLQSTRTRITLDDGGSSHSGLDRGGNESGKESARHDESDGHDENTRRERDENSKSIEKRTNQDESSSRTTNRDENLNHDENATSNNTTTGGSDVAKSPICRKTKTIPERKRKLNTILSNDDNESGPCSSKRLRTGGYDESTRDTGRRHGNDRSTGSKEDLGNHADTLVGQAAGNPTHDNNANVTSRGLSVPLRRSARKRKMRILGG
ncbi:hypothetical protein AGABI1DRAFT_107251 [Agaricus bisporus var. burnettii JB137-S8]|uniref:Uncharacterized protein n=1 Tax=Agaricus bisporus var. burnettii (strain JB137-S8 / ATCC MYA-4627 / FGSC 10392) TaxID=597362 RepID=K5WTL5_AGABU|nr:uncharacterized protein AGABI1DRAFT_107251 [Agaricus bisporus var. burnettii JB137-S8]EKM78766.1 hypothetical protein AGABI1DRAFT_107251 [Agaricus bisporus var. burnettii JB137-S8]